MAYGQHLKRNRCGTLCFRFVFPPDVRPLVGRSEVSVSLGTSSRRDAEIARIELTAWVKRVVLLARKSGAMDSNGNSSENLLGLLQQAQLKHLVRELNDAERDRDIEAKLRERARLDRDAALVAKELAEGERDTEKTLREQANEVRDAAVAAKRSAEEVAARVKEKLLELVMNETAPSAASPRLSVAIAQFQHERGGGNAWTPKTAEKWRHTLDLLLDWFGDTPIAQIDRHGLVQFRDALLRLPRNAAKIAQIRGKSMREQIESGFPPITASTVNQNMTRVAGFWGWMATNPKTFQITANIAAKLKIQKVESEKRKAFSDADLRQLFSTPEFASKKFLHTYMYWALPIALLTGARINEIAQLTWRTSAG